MKGVVLLSDGIDSPVAYHIMSRRMECVAIHFVKNGIEKVRKIMKLLKGKIYYISYDFIGKEITKVKPSYACVICKRYMYRIAEKICEIENGDIIITGENLGQVASQTLDNIMTIEDAVNMSVVRPLIAMDKEEIINIAKKIGTYEISIASSKRCPFAPKKPITHAKIERVREEEKKIKVEIEEAIKNAIIEKFD